MSYYHKCVDHLNKGQFSETELLARKWTEACPEALDPYTLLVFVHQAQMKWDELIEAGERYLKLWCEHQKTEYEVSPTWGDRWKVLLFMGQAHLFLNNESEAESLFEQSLSDAEDRVSCLTAIARIYKSRKKYRQALVYFKKAIDNNPEDKDILRNIAQLYDRIGDRGAGIDILKRLMWIGSLDVLDSIEILDHEIERENWKEAEKVLMKIIADYPPNIEIFIRAGIIFRKLGAASRSMTFLEKAANISPRDPRISGFLAFLFAELGRNEEALNLINDFSEDRVNFISVHLAAAWTFWLHGREEDTICALDRVYKLLNINYPETVSSFEDLIRALMKLGFELKQRMGLLEEHLALEIAKRIGNDSGVSVGDIEMKKVSTEGFQGVHQKNDPTVALCMIVKDEEEFLDKCLKGVTPLVDEMVIVDTGSTDRTIEIAGDFGAKIYNFKWCDDYSKARNFSLKQARCDWILVMDADELISERDLPKIRELLLDEHVDGYRFILRNYENDRTLANIVLNPHDYEEGSGCFGFIPSSLIRLFRRDGAVFFSGAVHETLDYSFKRLGLTAKSTDIPIHHYGKLLAPLHIKSKRELYRKLGEKRVKENPDDVDAVKGLSDQYLEMGLHQEALELLESGIRFAANNTELHFNSGRACEALNMAGRAIQEYIVTLKLNPEHIGAYNNLALIYLQEGNNEEAVRILNEGIEKGRLHPVFYHNLGNAYLTLGDDDRALQAYNKAIEIDPSFPGTNDRIQEILNKRALTKTHESEKRR